MSVDHDAWVAELRRSAGPLRRFCQRLSHRDEDAEELVQEAMARALARRPGLERPLVPWLVRVARNVHVDRLRKDWRVVDGDVDAAVAPDVPKPFTPWSGHAARLLRQHLRPRDLAVVLLREALDVTVADTATALGLSHANVRVVHHRALSRLQAPPPMSVEGSTAAVRAFDAWAAQHTVQCVHSLVVAVGGTAEALAVPLADASRVWQWVVQGSGAAWTVARRGDGSSRSRRQGRDRDTEEIR